jgi:hypothetical protein
MKKVTCFATLVLLVFMTTKSWSQDFTVTIASTDNCSGYIVPLKAGASIQFQIKVKNNRTDTCTVSIDKNAMGFPGPWVTIDNNSQVLYPQQSTNFLLTLAIPANTTEGEYIMWLNFNGYDKTGFNHSFQYTAQTVTVDNSVPLVPSFTVSPTSTTVYVSSWSSYDAMSNTYTNYNSSSGIFGIKSYTVALKKADNTPVGSPVTKLATDNNYHTFSQLSANTGYKVSVTATDMAGNTSTKELATTTAPAPPTISSSAQSFCNITLNWTAPSGATSYKLYNVTLTPVLVTTTSNTSFVVSGLTSGTTYKFYVKAYNSSGLSSDVSNTLTISTLTVPVPSISGSSSICSSGTAISVTNLPTGCNLEWSQGANLSLYSTNGSTATFKATGNATSWIKATINSGCGIASATKTVDAGSPKPGTIYIEFDAPPRRFTASIDGMVSAISYKWYLNGVLKSNTTDDVMIFQRQVGNCGYRYDVDVAMVNSYGTSPISHTEVYEPECYKSYTVYPNPASSEISITQNTENNLMSIESATSEPKMIKTIKIIDNSGFVYVNKKYGKATQEVSINISNLKTGTYQIIINEGEGQESQSFIKY